MQLHGHLESIDDDDISLSDDLPDRIPAVESMFAKRSGKAIDAYSAAARIDAPQQEPVPAGGRLSGTKLDFGLVGIPLVDEWGFPKHDREVPEVPGIYVVGLPWLTKHYSATVSGEGLDAEYGTGRIARGRDFERFRPET
ncbi:hypothetical protein NEK97_04810 [Paenarthrobacter sp. UW852]|uniref:hypothetical protein n=1 Tax=Paenarthrobacter sp. UW852 TaxID=2951989 RepID=UPI0021490E09|nr:hypothetical protein [Paenarthrobacter sp. UW852]MCR1160777.1 hypothetical protein [Paenarthrobacter sp. UW852]